MIKPLLSGAGTITGFPNTEKKRNDLNKKQRQRNSSQKKEQEKVMARDLIKTYISNMPEPEFKTTIIRILCGFEKYRRH